MLPENLKTVEAFPFGKALLPPPLRTGLPASHSVHVCPHQGASGCTSSLHPLKASNDLASYEFIYLLVTPLAYSTIPKGLLPLTQRAISYVFVSKNRPAAKNSAWTIWENLKFSIWETSNLKSNTEQTSLKKKKITPELPDHMAQAV